MIFTGIQDLKYIEKFEGVIFPFGIYFGMNQKEAIGLLGDYFMDVKHDDSYTLGWRKSKIFIGIEFDSQDKACEIGIRLLFSDEMA